MKKWLLPLFCAVLLTFTGCQQMEPEANSEKAEKIEMKETAEKSEAQDSLAAMTIEYDEAVLSVLAGEWKTADGGIVYTFMEGADGDISGEAFHAACSLDEESNILLKLTMTDSKEERNYFLTTDETGYGIYLDPIEGGEKIYLLQSDVELLDIEDARVSPLLGEWADKRDNRYIFEEAGGLQMKAASSETDGSYSVAVTEEGVVLKLLTAGGSLELFYEFTEDGNEMKLCTAGTDVIHTWTRQIQEK